MIHLTRLNHEAVLLNSDLIVLVEANPDTVISLSTGERLRVLESMNQVASRVLDFKRLILLGPEYSREPGLSRELAANG